MFFYFYHIWALRQYWSCDPDDLNNFSYPNPWRLDANLVRIGPVVSEEKSFEILDGIQTTNDGTGLHYKLPWSLRPRLAKIGRKKKTVTYVTD